jgi:hypothetical protein
VEEQRTNLLLRSSELDDATAWTKNNATVTANATSSPDGGVNADKIVEDGTNTEHNDSQTLNVTSGVTYTYSVYLKPAGRTVISLAFRVASLWPSGLNQIVDFTLTGNGSAASSSGTATSTIAAVGNGWYRCSITSTAAATGAAQVRIQWTSAGDSASGVYAWGAQAEAGSFATSYIPTTTAQVTRTADSVTMTGAAFSSWFNATQGTLYGEADIAAVPPAGRVVAMLTDATVTNAIDIRFRPASLGGIVTGTAGFSTGAYTPNAVQKMAIAFAANDFAFSPNGAAPATLTGTLPTGMDRLFIADPSIGQLNGHLRKLRFYPTRLPNAQLQVLTQ